MWLIRILENNIKLIIWTFVELDGGQSSKQKQFKVIESSKHPEGNIEVETELKLNKDDSREEVIEDTLHKKDV